MKSDYENIERLYRCEQFQGNMCINVYPVMRATLCGVWIDIGINDKFVNLKARKQWASITEKEAIEQFIYRTKRYIEILEDRLEQARIGMNEAEHEKRKRGW
jgi:hypothetical protein